ncbi:hypothetical protein [Brevibacterium sp. ZH18]|uniref:hypothetical protein n=1 Tax=Brevibacterium sp. ZH18 TaxID=2927784 RepID=UPI001F604AA6|nr:hypothetical protein [Brevibacterium sp. ZH18]MCI4012188.1 hypothetical protein [Brevibacterium sp. ZH18]
MRVLTDSFGVEGRPFPADRSHLSHYILRHHRDIGIGIGIGNFAASADPSVNDIAHASSIHRYEAP